MKIRCPHCRHEHDIAPTLAGHAVDCPSCHRRHLARLAPAAPVTHTPGIGKPVAIILIVLALLGSGLGFLCWRTQTSPLVLAQRWLHSAPPEPPAPPPPPIPAPAPEPPKLPDPPAEPIAAPAPVEAPVAPVVTEAPVPEVTRPDPLAWLLADKHRWPRQVTLTEPVTFALRLDGKPAGSVELAAGTAVDLTNIERDYVVVTYRDDPRVLAFEATDLLTRADHSIAAYALAARLSAPVAAPVIEAKEQPITPPKPKMGCLRIDIGRTKLEAKKTIENKLDVLRETWAFAITVQNRHVVPVSDIRIEYRLYVRAQTKPKTRPKVTTYTIQPGSRRIDGLDSLGREVFRSDTIVATRFADGRPAPDLPPQEQIYGIWVRAFVGDEMLGETFSPTDLNVTQTW